MGIDAGLKAEDVSVIARLVTIEWSSLASTLRNARLLRYLMPYVDTIFNQFQAPELRDDIRRVTREHAGTALGEAAPGIEPLVDRLLAEPHVYLWFIDD